MIYINYSTYPIYCTSGKSRFILINKYQLSLLHFRYNLINKMYQCVWGLKVSEVFYLYTIEHLYHFVGILKKYRVSTF